MIKQPITPERADRVILSVQKMTILAEMIKLEYQQDMDVKFKSPPA